MEKAVDSAGWFRLMLLTETGDWHWKVLNRCQIVSLIFKSTRLSNKSDGALYKKENGDNNDGKTASLIYFAWIMARRQHPKRWARVFCESCVDVTWTFWLPTVLSYAGNNVDAGVRSIKPRRHIWASLERKTMRMPTETIHASFSNSSSFYRSETEAIWIDNAEERKNRTQSIPLYIVSCEETNMKLPKKNPTKTHIR